MGRARKAVISLLVLAGCGQSGPRIEGKVAYNGQPVAAGSIAFLPADAAGQPFGDSIINGQYKIDPQRGPTPGKYKVQIRSLKPTGKKMVIEGGALQDEMAESLPKKYHDETTL